MPTTPNSAGQNVEATPVREVAGLTTTDAAGNTVDVVPVRYVDAITDVDELDRPIDAIPVVTAAGLIAESLDVIPVRTVAGTTATDAAGRKVLVRPALDTPSITSNSGGRTAAISVAENTTAVTTVAATSGRSLTYSISGGEDADLFEIHDETGVLTFADAPDFEAPADADADNAYHVTVRVSDGLSFDEQRIVVTVTNVGVPAAVSDLTAEAQSDTEVELDWTAAVGSSSHQYRVDGGSPTAASGPPMTVSGLTAETEYDFEVRGVNVEGAGPWSNVATETTSSGGDVTPLVSIDFKNGVHSIGGVSKTLAEVCEENTDWSLFTAGTHVVPGTGLTITSEGAPAYCGPVLTTAAKASLLSGFVAVITYSVTTSATGNGQASVELLDLPDYNDEWQWRAQYAGNSFEQISDYNDDADQPITAGSFKSAIIISDAVMATSRDGAANIEITGHAPLAATDVAIGATAAGVDGTATGTIEKIEFFSLTDYTSADLPALSA